MAFSKGDQVLIRALYTLLLDSSVTLTAGTETRLTVETIPSASHSFYDWSVYETTATGSPVVHQTYAHIAGSGDTAIVSAATKGVHAVLDKTHTGPPDAILVELVLSNHDTTGRTVAYRVYRRAGLV